ncbi:MAG: hypothetical protein ACOCVG_00585, partial [Verrucomicrobiota bacterium]
LKSLSPAQQDEAAKFIHHLKESEVARREEVIEKTFGCLTDKEADEWAAAIEECSRVDHENW